jgi:hypothetical protein
MRNGRKKKVRHVFLLNRTYSSYTTLRAVGLATSYHVLLGKPETKSGICIVYPIADVDVIASLVLHVGTNEKASDAQTIMEAANRATNAIDRNISGMTILFEVSF